MKNIFFIFALLLSIPSFSQNYHIQVMEPTDTVYHFTQEKVDTSEMVWFDKNTIHNGYVITTSITCLFDNTGDLEGAVFTSSVKFLDVNKKPLDPRKILMWNEMRWSKTSQSFMLEATPGVWRWNGSQFYQDTLRN
jgi:hypothetical protein